MFGDDLELEWQSFLLRPHPGEKRDLEKFKKYTESWKRPAGDEPEAIFRVWEGKGGPPSHSVPPHLVAKAARTFGSESFDRIHGRLLTAYFTDNLDISDDQVLRDLWREAELPVDGFDKREDPILKEAVFREHNEAIENGATGAPALQIAGGFGAIMGAQPIESYRLWFQRMLDRRR
jgi:predicted DsbA family dithiol-disulfide isomerase